MEQCDTRANSLMIVVALEKKNKKKPANTIS